MGNTSWGGLQRDTVYACGISGTATFSDFVLQWQDSDLDLPPPPPPQSEPVFAVGPLNK